MANLSAPIGAVVRVWFPESETVMQPGPKFRPGLILGFDDSNGRRKVLVATEQASAQIAGVAVSSPCFWSATTWRARRQSSA